MDKKYISKIVQGANTLYIKDTEAHQKIGEIETVVTGAMHYIGITTSAIADGSTTNPIIIEGQSVTAAAGDVAIYGEKEYVFNGTKWQEFGSTGSLKALAFKDNASGSIVAEGSNASSAVSNFTGGESKVLATTSITGVSGTEVLHDTPTLNTTTVGSASGWDAGTMFAVNYDDQTESLTLTAGTAPSLTISNTTVGSSLTAGTAKTVATANENVTIVATGAVANSDNNGATVVTLSPTGATAAAQVFTGSSVNVTVS